MNMNGRVLLTLALLATFYCQTAGKLMVKPRDTDIKVNHSTYFNCSTDIGSSAIFWFHGTKYVYIGDAILDPYSERFVVDRTVWNGTYIYNLIIHSVQPSDAGEYICSDDEVYGEKYPVQLVVLEGDPICRSNGELDEVVGQNTCNVEPGEVELECSVTYHGNIPPQLEWKKVGENSSTPLNVSVVTSRNHFVSTLKLKGDIALNNSSYVCETRRTTQEPNNCISKVIKILYAVSGNPAVNKTINDEIHCSANTSQSCSYNWKWLQDNDFKIESSTSILKARKPGWHRCEAECYLRNNTCNLLVMRAMVYTETEPSTTKTIIIIAVVVSVVAMLAVVGVLRCVFHYRRLARQTEFSDEEATGNELSTRVVARYDDEKSEEDHVSLYEPLTEPLSAIYGLEINGIAVLGQEMFISHLKCPDIEVYDSTTFHMKRRMEVRQMKNPEHIVSCSVNNCLYDFDWNYQGQLAILRIDPTNGHLIKAWTTDGRGGQLSVASDTNVILNINYEAKLHEYTADGELIREIDLDPMCTGIVRSWHAVKLDNCLFVVCHGGYGDPLSRVCLLSVRTATSTLGRTDEVEILKTFGGEPGEQTHILIGPIYLSLDREGSILVSDASRKTVLLNSNLDEPQIIVSEEHGLWSSRRTCFDESTGQWFVADQTRVMVCRVKGKKVERKLYYLISE